MLNLTKQHLSDLYDLIFVGYLTTDIMVLTTYFSIRTLTSEEYENISARYRYCDPKRSAGIILDTLREAIVSIGGIKIKDRERLYNKLCFMHPSVINKFYSEYAILNKRGEKCAKYMEYFVETDVSKRQWMIYKSMNNGIGTVELYSSSALLNHWIFLNLNKEHIENERREWTKVGYMTNSICQFVNPDGYKKNKNSMDVTKSFEDIETIYEEKRKVIAEIYAEKKEVKKDKGVIIADNEVFEGIRKKEGETEKEHVSRVESDMKRKLSGKVQDEHDEYIRKEELVTFRKAILERRLKVEIAEYNRKKRRYTKMDNLNEIIEDDERIEFELDEDTKKSGMHHNGVSYLDVLVGNKFFQMLPKEDRLRAFKEVMEVEIDIEKAAEIYMSKLNKSKEIEIEPPEQVMNIQHTVDKDKARKAMRMEMPNPPPSNPKGNDGGSGSDQIFFG